MSELNTKNWKNFDLITIFDMKAGKYYSRESYTKGRTSLVSASEDNNGVIQFTGLKPKFNNCLTIGKIGISTFYQNIPFVATADVTILIPKIEIFNKYIGLFLATILNREKYKWSYGRQIRLNDCQKLIIKLPATLQGKPDWEFIENYIKNIYKDRIRIPTRTSLNKDKIELSIKNWNFFEINSLFSKIEKAKCNNASLLLTEGDDIFYIGAKKKDNGVMNKVKLVENIVSKGNAIVLIGDGQGSVGYALYQPIDFIGSTTLTIGYNEKLNKYNAMFIVTVLDLERYRYSFGRKYGKSTGKAKIKLPSTAEGKIDWEYMENYIKSLPYSAFL